MGSEYLPSGKPTARPVLYKPSEGSQQHKKLFDHGWVIGNCGPLLGPGQATLHTLKPDPDIQMEGNVFCLSQAIAQTQERVYSRY